jgi:hypothetical protein
MMSRAGEAQNPGLDQQPVYFFGIIFDSLDKGLYAGDGTA